MAATGKVLVVFALCMFSIVANGDMCLGPQVTSQTYTTPEAIVSTETVFIVEFSVACKNGLKNINLYAEFGGKTVPASKIGEPNGNKFQLSLSDEHKKLPSGNYQVRVFDEEGYAWLRKAQRSGENLDNIKPLFTLDLSHSGVWSGPVLQSEFVAAMTAIFVWWSAYTAKSRLQQ
ncbi:translocon-associated protein subunit delta-like [Littorina saxatilis]|uniref:Translocon-associated protein subunit delta n=1 Tax=Littorina saxatilis TaxID=31220 RepID=A0AAN9BCF2_9CAEN